MSWTDNATVKKHLLDLDRPLASVRDVPVNIGDDGIGRFPHTGFITESDVLKIIADGDPAGPSSLVLAGLEWSDLPHSHVRPGEVVVADDEFLNTVFEEGTDYVVDYRTGKVRRLPGSGIASDGTVVTFYQRYEVLTRGVDYTVSTLSGQISGVSPAKLETGLRLVVDYDLDTGSGIDALAEQAIVQAEDKILPRLREGFGASSTDQGLVTGATELALGIICRSLAAQALSDGAPSAEGRAKLWLQLAANYEQSASLTLRPFLALADDGGRWERTERELGMGVRRKPKKSDPVATPEIPPDLIAEPEQVWSWLLEFIKTLDAVGGIKPFPDYPFAKRMVEALCNERILIVAKSRQMMATWTVAAVTLYRALFCKPGIYLFLSKGARDSSELVKRLKVMVVQLPEDLSAGIKVTGEGATFPSGSRIISLPATEFAPRMHSPSGVVWDEVAFTPHSEEIWTSLKPAIDSGGSFVGVSTPNGMDNMFHTLFSDPSNGFAKLTLHFSEHPKRDAIWLSAAKKGLSEAKWKQEYEVDFNVLADRVFDEFDPARHILLDGFVPTKAEGVIYRGIDFGYHHPYVVWVHQSKSGKLTLFDEWEGENATLEELAGAIRRIDRRNGLDESNIAFTACDPAGASVNDEGVSSVERLSREGFKLVYKRSLINDGVDLLKSLLLDASGNVRLRIDPKAVRTIDHLRHYRWEVGSETPLKGDGHDHAVDALRYLVVNLWGRKPGKWSGAKVMGGNRI